MPRTASPSQHDETAIPAWFSRVKLSNFRVHKKLDLSLPSPAPVVLTGINGAGKTSLLEALSLLGPGRGLRLARSEKIMRIGERSGWHVAVKMFGQSAEHHIGTGCVFDAEGARRHVRMDGRHISAIHLARHIRMFWLTPAMARLFGEGSDRSARRRFIDRITMGFFPDHADHLAGFERARKARQSILAENRRADEWLAALETQMASHGVALAQARAEVVQQLNMHMGQLKPEVFPAAHISLTGAFEEKFWLKNTQENSQADSQKDSTAAYQAALARARTQDAAAGRATLGPHHADVILTHSELGLSARHCSAGEVKALLTALVLASAQFVSTDGGGRRTAVILLDDIAAHLDEKRRYGLFEKLADFPAQIWMTGTDRDMFAPLKMDAHFFTIAPGSAHPG